MAHSLAASLGALLKGALFDALGSYDAARMLAEVTTYERQRDADGVRRLPPMGAVPARAAAHVPGQMHRPSESTMAYVAAARRESQTRRPLGGGPRARRRPVARSSPRRAYGE